MDTTFSGLNFVSSILSRRQTASVVYCFLPYTLHLGLLNFEQSRDPLAFHDTPFLTGENCSVILKLSEGVFPCALCPFQPLNLYANKLLRFSAYMLLNCCIIPVLPLTVLISLTPLFSAVLPFLEIYHLKLLPFLSRSYYQKTLL